MMAILYVDVSSGDDYLAQPAIGQYLSTYFITNPKFNDEVIFFYRPKTPIIICGVNQNVYSEVDLTYCKAHGIKIARRGAGGGAVYVDPGNLTYCFVDNDDSHHYLDFKHYAQNAIATLKDLGVDAAMTGRNDLTVDGKKFSGMSALKIGNRFSTGGTLMVDVDLDNASRALRPPKSKMASKGVKSVHSRVTNLRPYFSSHYQNMTLSQLQTKFLLKLFHTTNLNQIPTYVMTDEDWRAIEKAATKKFGDQKWIMGEQTTDMYYHSQHFAGVGTVEISFSVDSGVLTHAKVFGDFNKMNGNLHQIETQLIGTPYNTASLTEAFTQGDVAQNIGNIEPASLAEMLIDQQFADKATIN
ncbi:MAG: lipoate--protein ligase [Lentilactobacillus hilgardii]|jgi:lipoate-protein ligase A|uniref:lipoate--protein ligase n=1 Tax=Lentilactobacillus hilgardii TaxID=1588 RepID=UPI001CC1F0B9|nr:lipoate--protein ligase [Lentilactobacillus hilgardii]MBZ2201000.1 lipoate--protein ligase [Lentilactobacillus hilgardii]MBZ2203913.1 lipoate--protein ligase [Lentilactobacillus hilgardii]MCI2018163.1 lipoate--protein ligase [Lentilactobacillus buchneri]